VSAWAYCPHCGNAKISSFPNNSPLADFFCASCSEEFELKSQKGKFGTRVVDGAFKTKCERLAASNNPNLLLMNYDLKSLAVVNLFIVPKHFFVREIIEERKPLAVTARRAGWIGSNILLSRVPESGKIHIVQSGLVRAKDWSSPNGKRRFSSETNRRRRAAGYSTSCNAWNRSANATSRSTRSMLSSGISVTSIPVTRTSGPRYDSNFSICAIKDLLISSRAAITVCHLRAARHGLVSEFL
jgi:hypothetical protein